MPYRGKLVLLPPHRVWRTYQGGRTLDALAGAAAPADSPAPSGVDGHFPEDWIASTTRAVNAGREAIIEGISPARIGGETHDFAGLVHNGQARAPVVHRTFE